MNKQIFKSKERYILKVVLNSKIKEYLTHREKPSIPDIIKYDIDCTIEDTKKILKKIDDPNYKESSVSYNKYLIKRFENYPNIKSEVNYAKSKR